MLKASAAHPLLISEFVQINQHRRTESWSTLAEGIFIFSLGVNIRDSFFEDEPQHYSCHVQAINVFILQKAA